MSTVTPQTVDRSAEGCSTVQDLFRTPEVSGAVQKVLGKAHAEIQGKTLREKLEYLSKTGFMTSNSIKTLLIALSSSNKIADFKGREEQVVAFLFALEDIEEAVNPGILRRVGQMAKDLAASVEIHAEAPRIRRKHVDGSISTNVETILNMSIQDILTSRQETVSHYKEMFAHEYSPINENGEIVTPVGFDMMALSGKTDDPVRYLKVSSHALGIHYIDKEGKVLKLKSGVMSRAQVVVNITLKKVKVAGWVTEKEQMRIVVTLGEDEYYIDDKGKLHEHKPEVDVGDILSGEKNVRFS